MKISLICLLVLMCGCHLGPRYHTPCADTPEEWKTQPIDCQNGPCVNVWWEVFDDDVLNWLEAEAILNNPNLMAALDRVAEARAVAGVDRAYLFPHLNLLPVYNDYGQLIKIFVPGTLLPGVATTSLETPFRVHQQLYTMPFTMTYELDLWGKLRGKYESDVYFAESQGENYRTALLTLTADVASNYFQLRALDTRIDILKFHLNLLQENLTLTKNRYEKGLVNLIDVVGAEQELSDIQASYEDIVRQRVLQENAIATLIGTPASCFTLEHNPLYELPPSIPPGMPCDILMQRPDIAAAERERASQHALIGVAYAAFLPSVQVTGILGYSSPTIEDFLTWFSRYWFMGANIGQVIFDAGKNQSNLNLAYAQFLEASHDYQQQVLTAFQEVEDALANVEQQTKEYQSYYVSVQSGEKRLQLSRHRYAEGLTNYLDVIDSERTVIQSELNEINALSLRYIATIQLIKAIGGSWGHEDQDDVECVPVAVMQ